MWEATLRSCPGSPRSPSPWRRWRDRGPWGPVGAAPILRSAGELDFAVSSPAGEYSLWLSRSFAGQVTLLVDGRTVGARRHRLEHPGQFLEFGHVALTRGRHDVILRYSGADWHPGSAADFETPVERVVFAQTTADVPVSVVTPGRAGELCGRSFDWIEAIR